MTTAESTSAPTPQAIGRRRSRPKLVVAATYPIHPARGGGQVRASQLYRGLAEVFDVTMVTLVGADEPPARLQLAPSLFERQIPKSAEHQARESELERAAGTVVTDIAMSELYSCTPGYLTALHDEAAGARAVVVCHPYTFPAVREVTDGAVWYEAQDVEASLKRHVLGASAEARRLLARTEAVERACCQYAESVWACSVEDREELVDRYVIDPDRVLVVPNGFARDEVRYVSPADRATLRHRLKLDDRCLGVFIASWHEPNLVGARELIHMAARMPDFDLVIVGSVGLAFAVELLPPNVQITGVVSLEFKQTILGVADVALNPVRTGSGTNLKMLDYFASGIPVISTAFGARGLGMTADEHYLECAPGGLPAMIRRLGTLDQRRRARMVEAARGYVEDALAWPMITKRLIADLRAPGAPLATSALTQ